jgi:hypothetical protein
MRGTTLWQDAQGSGVDDDRQLIDKKLNDGPAGLRTDRKAI